MAGAKSTYLLIKELRATEKFGLISQPARCATSVPSNIGKESFSNSKKEFCHFSSIALGSFVELETCLLLAVELQRLKDQSIDKLILEMAQLHKKSPHCEKH